jgi:hypothetical protein
MRSVDRRQFMTWHLMASGAAACLMSADTADAHPAERRWDMLNTLGTDTPHIEAGGDRQARLFDWIVGTWEVDYTTIKDDDSREKATGQLIAGWVLDGRALQDLWIWTEPGETQRRMGTTIRFYDAERKAWRVTWVSPSAKAVTLLDGSGEAGRIVLAGDTGTRKLRWTFFDITDDGFRWHGEHSRDGGATWRLREDHRMRRSRSRNR